MRITVAGEKKTFDDGISVERLIELENVETPQYVTVSINDEFIPSDSFGATRLNEGDSVEFLYFMGGGG